MTIDKAPPGPPCCFCGKRLRPNYRTTYGLEEVTKTFDTPAERDAFVQGEWDRLGYRSPWNEHRENERVAVRNRRKIATRVFFGTYGGAWDGRFCGKECGYRWAVHKCGGRRSKTNAEGGDRASS